MRMGGVRAKLDNVCEVLHVVLGTHEVKYANIREKCKFLIVSLRFLTHAAP